MANGKKDSMSKKIKGLDWIMKGDFMNLACGSRKAVQC